MLYNKFIFLLLFSFITVNTAFSNNDIKINFLKTSNYYEKQIKNTIENSESISILINTLNKQFDLKKKIVVLIGQNNAPFYTNETKKILIPYSFYQETYDIFKKVNYDKRGISIKEATIDVLIHTILHELAHALIDIYNLPVVGKQEDIADSFAAIILMEFFENADEILLSTSDIFKLYSTNHILTKQDFMSQHSLDIQRYYDLVCYMYGNSPFKYEKLVSKLTYTKERKLLCKEDYIKNVNSWFTLFKNYFNKNKT